MILCVCPNPAIDKFIIFDNFEKGIVNRVSEERSFPGGKGVHVALGIKELGEDVALLAFWGGLTGQWIKQECESKGIKCYGPEVEGHTRTCFTIKSNNDFNDTEILGDGPIISEKDYSAFLVDYKQLLKNTDIISMSGSWPKNTFEADYAQLIDIASKLDKKSFIDCSGDILLTALKRKPFAIHINHHEGYDIYKTTNPIKISNKLNKNCKLIAITYGSKGLYLNNGKEIIHALSKVDKVISAVGSGDSLMAGLIVACKRGYDLIETAKLAASCGAANCIREDLGMFYKNDVEELQERCEVKFKN
ncbi:MAG: 1-phosphofructokinase family hexose kinase [Flavobacteriaceae bacterium]|nr:1-phosphofructokinase family hexose kinase [Flavobacteriaceae bacterium]